MFNTIDAMWMDALNRISDKDYGSSRVGKMKELLAYSGTLLNPDYSFLLNPRRHLSPSYAAAELLWYLTDTQSIDLIHAYAPQYDKFTEPNGLAHGAYGFRIKRNTIEDQLSLVTDHLFRFPNSRQAVITMWNADDLWYSTRHPKKDIPCTLSLQFFIRDDELNLITTMRSNDVWLGMPYDIFTFTCIQRLVADALNVMTGPYTHQAGSLHLYEKNEAAAYEARANPAVGLIGNQWEDYSYDDDDWKKDIERALVCERNARAGRVLSALDLPEGYMLRDLVACCAYEWNEDVVKPRSPALQRNMK